MRDAFEPSGSLTVATAPGCRPRLLRAAPGIESAAEYREQGGYRALASTTDLLAEVERSGLLGRGGAGFPLAIKLRTVREAHLRGGDTVVVANGEEGEPSSIKDKWLLRHRPHLILDGLRLAAAVVGARRAFVYVSDPEAAERIEAAIAEVGAREFDAREPEAAGFGEPGLGDAAGFSGPSPGQAPEAVGGRGAGALDDLVVRVVTVEPAYVAGEETAAVQAINGGPALPKDKPPRPFEQGVAGVPTVVSNVETLSNLPFVQRYGGQAFRSEGTATSPGTFLATLTVAGRAPALYELPHGVALTDLLSWEGISPDDVRGALMGGYFAGMLDRDVLGATLDHAALRALGSGLGCGAISLITSECPVAVAAAVMSYFDRENAGQCGSCFNGTAAMAAALNALRDGVAGTEDLARLERWSVVLRGRGACGTLDGATNTAATLLARFPAEVTEHLDNRCPTCRSGAYTADRPFAVEAVAHA
ncbi:MULTISPECIES: NADH-ubiquinone oxidoreductase-F iron-sulfur binding region domain-containing protein [Nocardia]|uniref:NADH-ubiquinone oxidoreductase-F iron-sulfur binding region domain-containing protein n=1 Tax=Nocardia TaxID=1817 RepID=UPI00130096CC|nr:MULTISPECIES: NADH-ubiquinone oxidoreductase-F iron-sulfur binding region domain-containing protein [Nocardia]